MTSPDSEAELRKLLEKATPQNIDTAEISEDGVYDCPLCQTQGFVDGLTFTNYDGIAQGVQFFGIGPEHKASEALFRAAVKHLPALLTALSSQRERVGELEEALDGVLEAFSLGPLGCAAKYGPDVDVREIESRALEHARAIRGKGKANG
jgi:hypothetical protein